MIQMNAFTIHDFDFELPEELIAQHPLAERSSSRLMKVNKSTGEIEHCYFYQIIDFLQSGDVLVLNNTRVLPARLFGVKKDTGAHIECLLLHEREPDTWEILV